MPSAGQKKCKLYLATSLKELRDKASFPEANITSRNASSLSRIAMKLFKEAQLCLQMDEEKAYILLFRCLNAAEQMRKIPDGKSDKTFDGKMQMTALSYLEHLSKSLSERYTVKDEEKMLNGLHKLATLNGGLSLSPSEEKSKEVKLLPTICQDNCSPTQNGTHKTDNAISEDKGSMDCIKLYELMHDKMTTLIIFDCRPSEDFAESHIKHSSCVNIPEEILRPGITAATLGASLQEEARSLWHKRSLVDYVVLMDNDSSRSNMFPHSAINSLNLAISKWDASSVLKRNPVVLENGFQAWLMHYPTTVTKMPSAQPLSVNSVEFQESLPYIDVDFPDLDDLSNPTDSELMNLGFHEKSPSKASQKSAQQATVGARETTMQPSAFYIEKNVPNPFVDSSIKQRPATSAQTQVPMFDRKNKPKGPASAGPALGPTQAKAAAMSAAGPPAVSREAWEKEKEVVGGGAGAVAVEEVLRRQQTLADKQVAVSKEKLELEQAFQQLRQRRETEASQAMLELVQRKEEELLDHVQRLEDTNRTLQDKWKASEQEKNALIEKLQVEVEDKQHRDALAEKQDRKKKMDSEVERLRQERKKREKLEKENEELRQRLELQSDLASRIAQPPADTQETGGGSSAPPPARPAASLKPAPENSLSVTPAASIPTQKVQDGSGVYSVRLKGDGEGPSPNRGLSRSYSSPNIAQLMAEEDQRGDSAPPRGHATHDKVFKQAKLVGDECSPNINRALKPMDTSATRMRNFSPVFSSQPNTVCGLKNLGNTCFMNSVLQCLSHTQNLALYLLSGAYLKDIRSGNRGEVVQELASVFHNLWQTYRSISPHEFKNVVSRHMSVCEGYDQQDAHEFLVVLMEKLHVETNKNVSGKGSSPPDLDKVTCAEEALNLFWIWHLKIHNSYIVQSFEGVLQSRLTCSVCSHRACTYEVFSCLSLPIPSNSKCSLKDCIQSLLKAETMRGEAAWKCPNCKRKQEAEKKMGLCRLPPILIIHLKRFSYEGLWRRKLVTHVDFPLFDLNMEPYLIVPTKKCRYNLYAVVNHYGTLEGGHYTAYCKTEKWFNFDDHDVQPMSPSGVKTSAAYILFYSSVDHHV